MASDDGDGEDRGGDPACWMDLIDDQRDLQPAPPPSRDTAGSEGSDPDEEPPAD